MKRMVITFLMIVFALGLMLMLSGCTERITQGEVVSKQFIPAHTETRITPLVRSNGKTTTVTPVPFCYHYSDKYLITISGTDKDGNTRTAQYRVTKEVFEAVEIGAEFVYDKNMKPEEPEYQRERQ